MGGVFSGRILLLGILYFILLFFFFGGGGRGGISPQTNVEPAIIYNIYIICDFIGCVQKTGGKSIC